MIAIEHSDEIEVFENDNGGITIKQCMHKYHDDDVAVFFDPKDAEKIINAINQIVGEIRGRSDG